MDRNDCLKKVSLLVADNEVRKIIFNNKYGNSDFLTTTEEINQYFSNVLNLTFALIYAKFRNWKENDGNIDIDDSEIYNSYMRVNKTFSELYTEKNLNYSVIEPTIMDVQLDIHSRGVLCQRLDLSEMLNPDSSNRFAYFVQKAKIARNSSRGLIGKENLNSKYDELIEFLRLFPYLRKIDLEFEPLKNEFKNIYAVLELPDFENKSDDGTIPSRLNKIPFDRINRIVIKDDITDEILSTNLTLINIGNEFYYLEEVVRDKVGKDRREVAYLNYARVGSDNSYVRINLTADENYTARNGEFIIVSPTAYITVLRDLHISSTRDSNKKIYIKDFYAINYRYIKQLTMSVSDILTAENKLALRNNYQLKYPDLFHHVWDTIIAILFVKESATSVLQFLFSVDNNTYDKLLYNIQMRFGSNVFDAEKLKEDTKKETALAFERWVSRYFGENHTVTDGSNRVIDAQRLSITSEIRALKLIDYLSELLKINESQDNKYKSKYPLNINSHIQMLEWLTRADLSIERKKERTTSIVLNTLKALYVFYCGFFKYAEVKNDFRERSSFYIFSGKEIDEFQNSANIAFRTEVASQLKRLKTFGSSITAVEKVLDEIKKLNDECVFVKGPKTKNEILRTFLGRHYFLDFNQIGPLKELLKFENVNEKSQMDEAIKKIIYVYGYLQNGSDKESGLDGIYPYVGTYEYTHETRDGYRIAHFSISTPSRDENIDVEVLSEFRYLINSKYYCLPNKMCGSNEIKLWIEPTIIAYKNFVMIDEYD